MILYLFILINKLIKNIMNSLLFILLFIVGLFIMTIFYYFFDKKMTNFRNKNIDKVIDEFTIKGDLTKEQGVIKKKKYKR